MNDHTDNGFPRGSSAHNPDLNWSQVRETVLMLELADEPFATTPSPKLRAVAAARGWPILDFSD